MAKRISVSADGFGDAVHDLLDEYFKDVQSESLNSVEQVAVSICNELRITSPNDRGDYANGWYIKPLKKNRYHALVEIGNRHYQLTHLLEHGHIKVVHRKVLGFTNARPHIARAEQRAIRELQNNIERVAKG